MFDTDKYYQMYEEMKKLNPEETAQLVEESEDKEMEEFFGLVGNFLLQQKQKEVIEKGLF